MTSVLVRRAEINLVYTSHAQRLSKTVQRDNTQYPGGDDDMSTHPFDLTQFMSPLNEIVSLVLICSVQSCLVMYHSCFVLFLPVIVSVLYCFVPFLPCLFTKCDVFWFVHCLLFCFGTTFWDYQYKGRE